MSQLILRPKPRKTVLRWLLLVSPLFFFGPILNLVRLYASLVQTGEPLTAHQLGVAALVSLVPVTYLAALTHVFDRRIQVKNGVISTGHFERDRLPLSELAEVAGDPGGDYNDFQEYLILRFNDGRELPLSLVDYEEENLRQFLTCARQHSPTCRFTYSDVIPLESRGLFRFLISTAEPDSLIVKLSKSPLQDVILQLIKAHERNFWMVYGLLWVAVVAMLSLYTMSQGQMWPEVDPRGSFEVQRLGQMLREAETGPTFDLWKSGSLRLEIIATTTIDYFSREGLGQLFVLWFLSILTTACFPVAWMLSPTFLFVDSKSLGLGTTFLHWDSVKSVTLIKSGNTGDPLDGYLTIHDFGNQVLGIDLTRVPDGKRRQLLLRLIDRYAGAAERNDEFVRATNALVDIQFTDLWLESTEAADSPAPQLLSASGTRIGDGRYSLESVLGYGGQGTTYMARYNDYRVGKDAETAGGEAPGSTVRDGDSSEATGQPLVVKESALPNFADVRILQDATSRFQSGAELLKRLQHDQIVGLRDFFIENGKAYLVLEYLAGKTLRQVLAESGRLEPALVRDFGIQLCDILIYLHSQDPQVIHCDFAPDNLILTFGGKVKLVDFDVARVLDARAYSFVAGRPSYTPPEQFRGAPTAQSDLFALGADMHFLLTGKDPQPLGFEDEGPETQLSALEHLIAECLSFDAAARPSSAAEVKERLQNMEFTEEAASHKLDLTIALDNEDNETVLQYGRDRMEA